MLSGELFATNKTIKTHLEPLFREHPFFFAIFYGKKNLGKLRQFYRKFIS